MTVVDLDPEEIAYDLGDAYYIEKEAKATKDELRTEFFVAASAELSKKLAQRSVEIPDDILEDATDEAIISYVSQYHSGWRIVEDGILADGKALIEENPDYLPFQTVVRFDEPEEIVGKKKTEIAYGYVVSRSVVPGAAMVDDDRMRALEPALYEAVMVYPPWSQYIAANDESELEAIMEEYGIERQLREKLQPDEVEAIKPFIYEGPKTVRLLVRYASKEEAE